MNYQKEKARKNPFTLISKRIKDLGINLTKAVETYNFKSIKH